MAETETTRERWQRWEEESGFKREPGMKKWAERKGEAKPSPSPAEHRLAKSREALDQAVRAGKLKGTAQEHEKEMSDLIGKHAASFQKHLDDLKALAPEGTHVKGRVKALDSALGKLATNPAYDQASKMQDLTGLRIVTGNRVKDVYKATDAIKARYKVLEGTEEDAIQNPKGAYRSYHMTIEGDDGLPKEVQLRTRDQNSHADWSHNIYKPLNRAQRRMVASVKDKLNRFSKEVSDHYHAIATGTVGKALQKPSCPQEIRRVFGCP